MGAPQSIKRYTPQEYYLLEREAEYKSEYYNGEIFAMAGTTTRHAVIVTNILGSLWQRLKGKPWAPYESNQRVKVMATGLRTYPDASVFCDPIEYDDQDSQAETAVNPVLLFEVLSPGTEKYDRGLKSANFRQIQSLRAYVLVSQDEPRVEVYERQANNSWLLNEGTSLEAEVHLQAIDVTLPLAEVYDRLDFLPSNLSSLPPG